MEILRAGVATLGLSLTEQQVEQFQRYYELLIDWNQRFNLTRIVAPEAVQIRHFLDSIAVLPLLADLWSAAQETKPVSRKIDDLLQASLHAMDVGSGAGFPGIPLAILWPKLKLTLLDGTAKKIHFLQEVVAQLSLPYVQVVQGRAEEIGRVSAHRGQYDLVMARALAPLPTLVEYLLPLCRQDGLVLAYKGPAVRQELAPALSAIALLGGEVLRLVPLTVPGFDGERFILALRKISRTPPQYPRGGGKPRKQPLL